MDKKLNDIIVPGIVLLIITAVVSGLLGFVSSVTAEPIAQNRLKARAEAMAAVLPAGVDYSFSEETAVADEGTMVDSYITAKDPNGGGYAVLGVTSVGFGGDVVMFVGIESGGALTGVQILEHSETPGLGAKAAGEEFRAQFLGKGYEIELVKGGSSGNQIDAISGATVTSNAVTEAVNAALEYFNDNIAGGLSS